MKVTLLTVYRHHTSAMIPPLPPRDEVKEEVAVKEVERIEKLATYEAVLSGIPISV